MWIIWGPVSGERDLGVVAEMCPRCASLAPCRVSGLVEGVHLFFVPLAAGVTKAACTCGLCGCQFPCESWRYKEMVPAPEARSLEIERLLERTNPALRENRELSRRLERFADDPRFQAALQSLDELRPGALSTKLRADLLRWDGLDEGRREELVRVVDESARTMRFARSISPRIPSSAGCLIALVACLAVWTACLLVPDFGAEGLWWNVGVAFAGPMAGCAVHQFVLARRVRRWTHDVLVPEGRKSGIDFRHFVALLDELPPPGPRSDDVLRPLLEQAMTIRKELLVSEVKGSPKPTRGTDPDAF